MPIRHGHTEPAPPNFGWILSPDDDDLYLYLLYNCKSIFFAFFRHLIAIHHHRVVSDDGTTSHLLGNWPTRRTRNDTFTLTPKLEDP